MSRAYCLLVSDMNVAILFGSLEMSYYDLGIYQTCISYGSGIYLRVQAQKSYVPKQNKSGFRFCKQRTSPMLLDVKNIFPQNEL